MKKDKHSKVARNIILVTVVAIILGILFTVLTNRTVEWLNIKTGIIHGGIIGFLIACLNVFNIEYLAKRWRNAPLLLMIIGNSLLFIFLLLVGRALGFMISHGKDFELWSDDPNFVGTVVFVTAATLGYNFLTKISSLMGQRVMWNILIGKYRKHKTEFRLIMFLDIVASTTIAETIGDKKYLNMLDRFFYLMTGPLVESKGIIYKYIGDEVIITWNVNRTAIVDILKFYFSFQDIIKSHKGFFLEKYGWAPEFKAGLHADKLVVGEMGEVKKEIVLIGNSLNTTARIVSFCKSQTEDLVMSKAVKELVRQDANEYTFDSLGKHVLKGKEQAIELYGVVSRS